MENPLGAPEPKNADQAYALMIFQAGYLRSYTYPNQLKKAKQEWLNKFDVIPNELKTNSNIQAIAEKGFDWALERSKDRYGF